MTEPTKEKEACRLEVVAKAFSESMETLAPLRREERERLIRALVVFFEVDPGTGRLR